MLVPHEHFLAFLDDIYIVCRLERSSRFTPKLRCSCGPRYRNTKGKLRCGTGGQVEPANNDAVQFAARIVDPEGNVWRGNANVPTTEQGVVILGLWAMSTSCKSSRAPGSIPGSGFRQWWICRQRG